MERRTTQVSPHSLTHCPLMPTSLLPTLDSWLVVVTHPPARPPAHPRSLATGCLPA